MKYVILNQLNNRHDKLRLLGLDKEMCFEKGFERVQGKSITDMRWVGYSRGLVQ